MTGETQKGFYGFIGRHSRWLIYLAFPLISLISHWHTFDVDITGGHSWRQAQTTIIIRNFAFEDANILNARIDLRGEGDGLFRMEFPLMQWLFSHAYRAFGEDFTFIRILAFILSILTLWGFYRLCNLAFRDQKAALLGTWMWLWSPMMYFYAVAPLPDLMSLAFSLWGMVFFLSWYRENSTASLWLTALFMALGALCKLPYILFFALPAVYFLSDEWRKGWTWGRIIRRSTPFLILISLPAAWYAWVIPGWGENELLGGVTQVGWGDLPLILYYIKGVLVSILPESIIGYGAVAFVLTGIYLIGRNKVYRHPLFGAFAALAALYVLYWLYEVQLIADAHDYYFLPYVPGLFLVGAYGADKLFRSGATGRAFTLLSLAVLPVFCLILRYTAWDMQRSKLNTDMIRYKAELHAAAPEDALAVVGNDISGHIGFYYTGHKGWAFYEDALNTEQLTEYRNRGAEYLYSDSRLVEQKPGMDSLIGEPIGEYGTVRVYRLKK